MYIPDYFLPINKSGAIRLLLLGQRDRTPAVIRAFNERYVWRDLPDDVQRMHLACSRWHTAQTVCVGESATVLRFLWWHMNDTGIHKGLERAGTLVSRRVTLKPEMLGWPLEQLIDPAHVPERTSQLASAAILHHPDRHPRLKGVRFHIDATYEALDDWNGGYTDPAKVPAVGIDPTIKRQAETFLAMLRGEASSYEPQQVEDFPFSFLVRGTPTIAEAAERWPNLADHESNRLKAVTNACEEWRVSRTISSYDHRIVQATAMYAMIQGYSPQRLKESVEHPEVVAKSWPQFWRFLQFAHGQVAQRQS